MNMKIENVYIKPDGQICACVLPVPDKPQFSALERLSPATQSECNKIIELHEQALKACKESAVLFEDQFSLTILLHASLKIDPPRKNVHEEFKEHVKNDTFYPLQCSIQIGEACAHDSCPVDAGCEHCKEPMQVARLIPEAKEESLFDVLINSGNFTAPKVEESDCTFIIDFCTWRDNKAWEFDYREQKSHTIKEQLEIYKSITRNP